MNYPITIPEQSQYTLTTIKYGGDSLVIELQGGLPKRILRSKIYKNKNPIQLFPERIIRSIEKLKPNTTE
jgi:hypothetical protein